MLISDGLVILLIDMQKGFITKLREGEKERIVPNQIRVLEYYGSRKVPIIVIEGWPEERLSTIEELWEVIKKSDEFQIITKYDDDAFSNAKLRKKLQELNAKKLLIMGINACYCVRSTAEGAIRNGYEFITSNDLISGMRHHSKDNDIHWFSENGSCLESIGDLIEN